MTTYRSTQTIQAVQFTGTAIPEITCGGSPAEVQSNGCDSSRKQHIHVHTQAIGGMTVLQPGDWIFAVPGGPWGTASDAKFRAHWEVPAATTKPTIAELEAILNSPAPTVYVQSDGSLGAVPVPEASPDFSSGDIVVLKSGGPDMRVIAVDDNHAACEWTAIDGTRQVHLFLLPMLRPVPEVAPPETAVFPEAPAVPPVDVAVVSTTQSVPVIGQDGNIVAIHHIETFPDGSTNITETPAAPVVIPVPVPHAHAHGPETAVGEGLVNPPEAPTNPSIFTD